MKRATAALFRAGVRLRNSLYDREYIKAKRLSAPVVSIGNLSVGGSGKTPFLILLGKLLQGRGIAFDVLSRGYGRSSQGVFTVDPNGAPEHFGDEPLLIARQLGVPVIVGEDRLAAGRHAEREHGPRLHLLDDAFQHRQLVRDFDIVLIGHGDLHDRMLPAGRLREPVSALRRADAIVVTGCSGCDDIPLHEGQQLWRLTRGLLLPSSLPARPVAFCGIARPQNFFAQLQEAGVEPIAHAAFRDHHRYTTKDIADLQALAKQAEADGFVTTEKDEVNLGGLTRELQPLSVIPVHMQLEMAGDALDFLLATVRRRNPNWSAPSPDAFRAQQDFPARAERS
jgi:tetraacyldisaccharide 4'-kinase